jgi:hypothetical protein
LIKFILGETKEVKIRVISKTNDPFTIAVANFELKNDTTGETEETGSGSIKDHEITALVTPTEKGPHTLIYTYEIALEKLKADVKIEVR